MKAYEDGGDTASKMQIMNRGRSSRTEFKLPQDEAHTGLCWLTSYTLSIRKRGMSLSEFSLKEE
jgi:hypothetical protein